MQDDRQTIQRVLAGETEAFRALVEKYQQSVFVFVRNLLRNATDAEDMAQEVFLAAYRHLASFDSRRSAFSTWLLTIARNRCCNQLKRRVMATSPEGDPPCSAASPEAVAAGREVWLRLDAALEQLPLEQRTAFVLAEIQELPYAEIAQIEGVELGTVKSRVSRAKERLRQAMQDWLPAGMPSHPQPTSRSCP